MKLLYTVFFFAAITIQSYGQKIDFTDSTNKWRVYTSDFGISTVVNYHYLPSHVVVDTTEYMVLVSNNGFDSALIRKDKTGQKIYAKVYRGTIQPAGGPDLDTNEHLLYDFSLQKGDTFHYKSFAFYVDKIDSVQMNTIWHKTFSFKTAIPNVWKGFYTVIEGIGAVEGLWYPLGPEDFEGLVRLSCFSNSTGQPKLPSKVGGTFDNNESCHLNIQRQTTKYNNLGKLYPQPAHTSVTIEFPDKATSYQLSIINTLGQTVFSQNNIIGSKIIVNRPENAGLYYYWITDIKTGKTTSGKLLFE